MKGNKSYYGTSLSENVPPPTGETREKNTPKKQKIEHVAAIQAEGAQLRTPMYQGRKQNEDHQGIYI